jgi:hypothetical protein
MNKTIKSVWIESEEKGAVIGGHAPEDDNSDVIVTLTDNSRYIATFFTYTNIVRLRQKNKRTGGCLNGKYFWASDMILIEKINRDTILSVVKYMIETEDYRVMKRKNELGEHEFAIYEVYYDETGKESGWTDKPLTPTCTSEDNLLHELTIMMEAFKKETLDYDKD